MYGNHSNPSTVNCQFTWVSDGWRVAVVDIHWLYIYKIEFNYLHLEIYSIPNNSNINTVGFFNVYTETNLLLKSVKYSSMWKKVNSVNLMHIVGLFSPLTLFLFNKNVLIKLGVGQSICIKTFNILFTENADSMHIIIWILLR